MNLHYLYSDQKRVQAATITLDGVVQRNCTLVDDTKGYVIRRTYDKKTGLINGRETVYGRVCISIPAVGKHAAYRTPEHS